MNTPPVVGFVFGKPSVCKCGRWATVEVLIGSMDWRGICPECLALEVDAGRQRLKEWSTLFYGADGFQGPGSIEEPRLAIAQMMAERDEEIRAEEAVRRQRPEVDRILIAEDVKALLLARQQVQEGGQS